MGEEGPGKAGGGVSSVKWDGHAEGAENQQPAWLEWRSRGGKAGAW